MAKVKFSRSKTYRVPSFGSRYDGSRYLGHTRSNSLRGSGLVRLKNPRGEVGAFFPDEIEEEV